MKNLDIPIPFSIDENDKRNILTHLFDVSYGIILPPASSKNMTSTTFDAFGENNMKMIDVRFSSGFFSGYYIIINYDEAFNEEKLKEVVKNVLSHFVQEKYTKLHLNF